MDDEVVRHVSRRDGEARQHGTGGVGEGLHIAVAGFVEAWSAGAERDAHLVRRAPGSGAPRRDGPVDEAKTIAGVVEVGDDQVVTGGAEPVDCPRDGRWHQVERHDLRVRMLDRSARSSTMVDHDLYERAPGGEVTAGAVSEHGEHLSRLCVVELSERVAVRGGEDYDLVRASRARSGLGTADDGVEVRHDAHTPPGSVGRAVARPVDLGRRQVLVAGAERARIRSLRIRRLRTERVRARGAPRCEEHPATAQLVPPQFRHGRSG